MCGIKSRGRQRTKYTDSLKDYVKRKESSNNGLTRRANYWVDWKAVIADVCNIPGRRS